MARLVLATLLLIMTVLPAQNPASARPTRAPTEAVLSRAADGTWLLDYRFSRAAPAWFFVRSSDDLHGKPWRAQSWTVETPGVRIERIGHYDVLVGDGRPLSQVRIRVRPFTDSIAADYAPVLAFSDGGVALYTEHHLVAPLASAGAARDLPADLNGVTFDQVPLRLTVADPGGTLLLDGKLYRDAVRMKPGQDGTYLYSGAARAVETPAFAGIVDPGLPPWIREELDRFTPRLFDLYTARLGKPSGTRPTLLAAWGGTDFKGFSQGGSVLRNMVVMNLKGTALIEASVVRRAQIRWFIGHEGAHFWLGQTVDARRRSDAWITEGGADLLAMRALQQLDPSYDPRATLQEEMDDCIRVNSSKPLSRASERGEHRANYACGAVLMMAAEGAARKSAATADLFTWLRALIDSGRREAMVGAEDWVAAYAASGGADADGVRSFLSRGVSDPATFLHALLVANGVGAHRDGDRVILD